MSNYIDYDNAVELFTEVGNKRKASESMQESLLKSTVGWTGKNLLPNNAKTQTINGVTFTVNADGSVTANGTATANTFFVIYPNTVTNKYMDKIINGCPAGGNANTSYCISVRVGLQSDDSYVRSVDDIGNGREVPRVNTSTEWLKIYIRIASGYTANNLKFYPMLRDASITDDTYEPYHKPVSEWGYTREEANMLGAKNLLPNNAVSVEKNGLTFTVNNDGSVTVNGTATNGTDLIVSRDLPLLYGGRYILSGCPTGGAINKYRITAYQIDSVDGQSGSLFDIGNGLEFTYKNTTGNALFIIYIENGVTVNNLTFYPMLRLASDPDDTYVPYAMTNREITEELTVQESAVTDIIEGATVGSDYGNHLIKKGNVVQLVIRLSGVSAQQWTTTICKIPEGYRPKYRTAFRDVNSGKYLYCMPSGIIQSAASDFTNSELMLSATWITN